MDLFGFAAAGDRPAFRPLRDLKLVPRVFDRLLLAAGRVLFSAQFPVF